MKKISFAIVFTIFSVGVFGQGNPLKKIKVPTTIKGAKSLSNKDVIAGLKEALNIGATNGTNLASKADGFLGNSLIKIPFPPESKQIETKLRQIGMGKEVDRFITSLNRAAEDASTQALPIFSSAINGITISDGVSILKGDKNAATKYLQNATSSQLSATFLPIIKSSLDKVNATKYYKDLVTAYNKLPGVKKMNADLDQYATDKSISGLFLLVEKEEANIRDNPSARVTETLQRVFN